jgi:hypothetical protein
MDAGVNGPVSVLKWYQGDLLVAGNFTTAGSVSAASIARWDGANWTGLGEGIQGNVYALAVTEENVYAGGAFTVAGSVTASNLARWDGVAWAPLGNGVNGPVHALVIHNQELVAGGKFTSAGDVHALNIARWNGSQWSTLGSGVTGVPNPFVRIRPPPVSSLVVWGDDLYVGGDFAVAGEISATNIACWNGQNWSSVGGGLPGTASFAPPSSVATMMIAQGRLLVGGNFPRAGEQVANGLASWDGTNWTVFDRGVTRGVFSLPSVRALAWHPEGLCVGGHFKFAGGSPASDFSIWRFPPRLRIERLNHTTHLSWTAADSDYFLQATEDLSSESWHTLTNAPVTLENRRTVIDHRPRQHRFYRLSR